MDFIMQLVNCGYLLPLYNLEYLAFFLYETPLYSNLSYLLLPKRDNKK